MSREFIWAFTMCLALSGCSRVDRDGVMSTELPLTLNDLAEIRAGEENHQRILTEYFIFESPNLETYLNTLAADIAAVSTRPHLPYRVVLLDDDEVNAFGGSGGYIYMTRGLLNFVQSESEIAGVIAHEIGHISHYDYAHIPQVSKAKFVYEKLLQGSELAKDSIGSYGTAMNYGLKGIRKAAPHVARQFASDAEIVADEKAVEYMLAAGYDPRAYNDFVERLARVEMADVGRFVIFMNTHPPFQDRRDMMTARLGGIDFDSSKIEFKNDTLNEVRQITINAPTSILFVPQLGVHNARPLEIREIQEKKQEELAAVRGKRWGWF